MSVSEVPQILLYAKDDEALQLLFIALQGFSYLPTKCHELTQGLEILKNTKPACAVVDHLTEGSVALCQEVSNMGCALIVLGEPTQEITADGFVSDKGSISAILAMIASLESNTVAGLGQGTQNH